MSWLDPDARSRSSRVQSFCEPLWLAGWSDRSIWGFDEPTGSYFAQLWPDGYDANAPAVWIGGSLSVSCLGQLAGLVVSATGADPVVVFAVLVPPDHEALRRS